MCDALVKFREEHGHCNVSLNDEEYLSLGRWVATQRFRRKINSLSPERVQRLKDIGFVWSVSESNWEQMFAELVRFKKKQGHCNVPAKWAENRKLATWVSNLRHKRKKGLLSRERICRLNEVGFLWAAWSKAADRRKKRPTTSCCDAKSKAFVKRCEIPSDPMPQEAVEDPADAMEHLEEKLYNVAPDVYVQHNDLDKELPPELRDYIEAHNGEWPPYIPLPPGRVEFVMGNPFMVKRRKVVWPGHGPLDPEIIEYANDNGVLPEWRPSR